MVLQREWSFDIAFGVHVHVCVCVCVCVWSCPVLKDIVWLIATGTALVTLSVVRGNNY